MMLHHSRTISISISKRFDLSLVTGALLIGMCVISGSARAVTVGHVDTFDAGTALMWSGFQTPTVVDSGGPAGDDDAFILVEGRGGNGPGSRVATNNQTADWTGDYLAEGVEAIQADLMSPVDSSELSIRLVLFESDRIRWTSNEAMTVPNDGVWRTYTFPVDQESLTLALGTSTYTQSLSAVDRVMLRHQSGPPRGTGTPISAQMGLDNLTVVGATSVPCDFDGSGSLDLADINLLLEELRTAGNDPRFDVDENGSVDSADLDTLISSPDKFNTYIGDANLDGEFSSGDLVTVFAAGQYEDDVAANSTWETGDWNGDGDFNSSDLVAAFAGGGFEQGPRAAASAVPEPTTASTWLFTFAFLSCIVVLRMQ